ncbi:hypothetical protein, partial [Bifidobacterium felsineum]|uniref:hypothetical protein n=1 Tax=Bifidobacterium felsineum TaxID=2045440 RepID=UPI001BDBCCD7
FAQAFFVIHFFGRKTEYAGTPLTLTESTAQRRTDTHENNNSAFNNKEGETRLVGDVSPSVTLRVPPRPAIIDRLRLLFASLTVVKHLTYVQPTGLYALRFGPIRGRLG